MSALNLILRPAHVRFPFCLTVNMWVRPNSKCYPMANVHEGTKDKTAFIAATLCDSEQLMSRRAEE